MLLLSLSSSLSSLSTLSTRSSSPGRDSPTEDFNRLRRAPPLSTGRDRLKRACTGGVGGLGTFWIGSVVTFVQFVSASRCVDVVGLCSIACERKAERRGTRRDASNVIEGGHVVANWFGVCHGARQSWLFDRLLQQLEKRSESA